MSKGNRTRRREAGLLPEPVHCHAHKRNGEPCGNYAMHGQQVCGKHGGKAPQNIAKAERRLATYADVLMKELLRIATSAESEAVRLAAVRDALDRIGIGSKRELEVTLPDWKVHLAGVLVDVAEPESDLVDAELVVDRPAALPAPRDWDGRTSDNVPPKYVRGEVVRWQP